MTRKYFGTDGIRDVAGKGLLAADLVSAYGMAFGRFFSRGSPAGRILVGRDTRMSGPEIAAALSAGLTSAGLSVVDGGVLTTPAVQALCREEGFAFAIVVSASHNPAGDNGIKIFGADGRKLPDDSEVAIEGLIDAARNEPPPPKGRAPELDPNLEHRYVALMRETWFPHLDLRGRTIILDCAHGAASHLGPRLLDAFGARVIAYHASPNGNNINDRAGVFFVENLADAVTSNSPAIGVALDGDADRSLFLDETGAVRDGDHLLGLLAEDLHRRKALSHDIVVTTVMANLGLARFLNRLHVRLEIVPVGDRHVTARMEAAGAVLGGEQSGHIIFRDGSRWFGDGLYTMLRVLDVMCRTERTLQDLASGVEKFPQVLRSVRVRTKTPYTDVPALASAVKEAEGALGAEGRVVARYSGTEPIFRIMAEGRDADVVARLVDRIASIAERELG